MEDVGKFVQLSFPDKADAILTRVALQPVVDVLVVEDLHILITSGRQAVFHGDIVEERLLLSLDFGTRRHPAAKLYAETVVPETFRKAEAVVGMRLSCGIGGVVEAHLQVDTLQGTCRDVVDLALQERAQCGVHRERIGVAIGQIHAGGEHGDGELTALFLAHRVELALHLGILWGFDDEHQAHVLQRLGDDHAAVEQHAAALTIFRTHGGTMALGGRDVQRGIAGLAGELHVAALLQREGLQRDDGQRVFHRAGVDGVAAGEVQAVGIHPQTQIAAS